MLYTVFTNRNPTENLKLNRIFTKIFHLDICFFGMFSGIIEIFRTNHPPCLFKNYVTNYLYENFCGKKCKLYVDNLPYEIM